MKTDRLLGIITILQQKGKVTAPYLAERFEVSRRTINRDIEDICRAGIPIVTTQGAGGGISIMEGFTLDSTVFTRDELQMVLAGLKSVGSVSEDAKTSLLIDKLSGGREVMPLEENVMIDLASFYKGSLTEKISMLKQAISERKLVSFQYYYSKGEEVKTIEPYLVVYKWASWYVFGFSTERQDFRLYKLGRLWDLKLLEESFEKREIPPNKLEFGTHITDDKIVKIRYHRELKYRLVEEYGPDCYSEGEDGWLYTEWGFTSFQSALDWCLGFGSRVEILEPEELRQRMRQEIHKMEASYEN